MYVVVDLQSPRFGCAKNAKHNVGTPSGAGDGEERWKKELHHLATEWDDVRATLDGLVVRLRTQVRS